MTRFLRSIAVLSIVVLACLLAGGDAGAEPAVEPGEVVPATIDGLVVGGVAIDHDDVEVPAGVLRIWFRVTPGSVPIRKVYVSFDGGPVAYLEQQGGLLMATEFVAGPHELRVDVRDDDGGTVTVRRSILAVPETPPSPEPDPDPEPVPVPTPDPVAGPAPAVEPEPTRDTDPAPMVEPTHELAPAAPQAAAATAGSPSPVTAPSRTSAAGVASLARDRTAPTLALRVVPGAPGELQRTNWLVLRVRATERSLWRLEIDHFGAMRSTIAYGGTWRTVVINVGDRNRIGQLVNHARPGSWVRLRIRVHGWDRARNVSARRWVTIVARA